jgi:hypothetical protein
MEILFVLVVALTTGYQAGKAGAKAEARDTQQFCMVEMDMTEGCYNVTKVKKTEPQVVKK